MIRKLLDVNKLFTIVFLLIYSHMESVKLEALNQHTTTPISPLGRKRGRRLRDRRREEGQGEGGTWGKNVWNPFPVLQL